jgi:hypothetical protein
VRLRALLGFAVLYGFAALGASSVRSTAMSEAVPAGYLARAVDPLDPGHRDRRCITGRIWRRVRP